MEQKIKNLIGEYVFSITALQCKIEELEKELKELKEKKK